MTLLYNKKIAKEEWPAVILSFAYFFFILAAYYVMRPLREQLSAAVGSTELPWFFAATFVVTLLLTPVFAWLVSRWPRKIVLPLVYLFFIGCQLIYVPFFAQQSMQNLHILGMTFFVWVSVFNLFIVSVFWSFMVDIWNDEQARRIFPIISLGGTTGAIIGPALTRQLVGIIGIAPLLLVSGALLICAMICMLFLGRWSSKQKSGKDTGIEKGLGGGMLDGLKQVFNSEFLRNMAFLMLLGDAIGTVMYALMIDYLGVTFTNPVSRTRFAANIDLATNILQFIVQLTLTRWLLIRYGAGMVIVVVVAVNGVFCFLMALASEPSALLIGNLPWIAVAMIITRSLGHAMMQPARETLFTLVPRDMRYKGKNAVDTAVWRGGDVISAVTINGLRKLGMGSVGFSYLCTVLLGVAGVIGWRLSQRVEKGEFLN